jgi:hypothetical protein
LASEAVVTSITSPLPKLSSFSACAAYSNLNMARDNTCKTHATGPVANGSVSRVHNIRQDRRAVIVPCDHERSLRSVSDRSQRGHRCLSACIRSLCIVIIPIIFLFVERVNRCTLSNDCPIRRRHALWPRHGLDTGLRKGRDQCLISLHHRLRIPHFFPVVIPEQTVMD